MVFRKSVSNERTCDENSLMMEFSGTRFWRNAEQHRSTI